MNQPRSGLCIAGSAYHSHPNPRPFQIRDRQSTGSLAFLPAIIDRLPLPRTPFSLFRTVISMQAVEYLKELIPFSTVSSESNSEHQRIASQNG